MVPYTALLLKTALDLKTLSSSTVYVVQPAKNRLADNSTLSFRWPVNGRILLERHMCPADIVIVGDVFIQDLV